MPRVTLSGYGQEMDDKLTKWCIETGEAISDYDVCSKCAIVYDGEVTENIPADLPLKYNEPDDLLYILTGDVEHPSYNDDDYYCAICERLLTDLDD